MSIALLMVFAGFLLIVAGIKDVSFWEAVRGNFDVPHPPSASKAVTGG